MSRPLARRIAGVAAVLSLIAAFTVVSVNTSVWLGIVLLFAASCIWLIVKRERRWLDWLIPPLLLVSAALEFGDVVAPIWSLLFIVALDVVASMLQRRRKNGSGPGAATATAHPRTKADGA